MALEKHNMLYAVQYALAEYDETGAVSQRTMEMVGARAILLRYEIEGEMIEAVEAKAKATKIQEALDEAKEAAALKVRKGRKRKNCKTCGTRLTGIQKMYCSKKCSKQGWYSDNKDRVKAYNLKYAERQKQKKAAEV
jgi:hypothetical protein